MTDKPRVYLPSAEVIGARNARVVERLRALGLGPVACALIRGALWGALRSPNHAVVRDALLDSLARTLRELADEDDLGADDWSAASAALAVVEDEGRGIANAANEAGRVDG